MPIKSVVKNALGEKERGESPSPVHQVFSKDDEELAKIVEQLKVTVKKVGCGGGGSNTINRCMREGIFGAELIAANTDAKHLLSINANRKVLLGKRTTRGLGAGAIPQIGEESTRESEEDIVSVLGRTDMMFVTAGMGGGTGTGLLMTGHR
jgi:cell division protein FtsZ